MCRLFGITNFDYAEHLELALDFFALAEKGNVPPGHKPGHLDGWGIGWYKSGRGEVVKSGKPITSEKELFISTLKSIGKADILILHLRLSAWKGTEYKEHAHPFLIHNAMLAHNGTIKDYKDMLGEPAFNGFDTEALLRFALKQNSWSVKKAFTAAVSKIREKHSYSALNLLFSDGKTLFALREFTKWPDYYTLYESNYHGSKVVCSERITTKLDWTSLPKGEITAF